MKTTNNEITPNEDLKGKKMTRKAAITKAGFIAISAATTMMLLSKNTSGAPPTSGDPAPPTAEPSGGTWTKRS
jgi:hypothetical protein